MYVYGIRRYNFVDIEMVTSVTEVTVVNKAYVYTGVRIYICTYVLVLV